MSNMVKIDITDRQRVFLNWVRNSGGIKLNKKESEVLDDVISSGWYYDLGFEKFTLNRIREKYVVKEKTI